MLALGGKSNGNGIAFLVAAGIVFEIIAYACSSPQTVEINISKRGETLIKWVGIGEAQSAFFIGAAAILDSKHRQPILIGGGLAMVISWVLYMYAKQSGLNKPGEETEVLGGYG